MKFSRAESLIRKLVLKTNNLKLILFYFNCLSSWRIRSFSPTVVELLSQTSEVPEAMLSIELGYLALEEA
jgi:hypothetical protein